MLFNLILLIVTSGVTVCIDPGHGGSSSGAVGEYILEKDAVLEIGFLLQNWLCQVPGITRASLTRDDDYDVSLQARTDYANANGFDLFVSIHENAFNGTVQGTETFCGSLAPPDPSFQMASHVQEALLSAYGYADRGVKDGSYLHVIRETVMPAILGEGSFLDYDLLWNESYLYAFNVDDHCGVQGWGYADALCSFLGFTTPSYGNGVLLVDNLSPGFSLNDSTLWNMETSGAPWMGSCVVAEGGGNGTAEWTSMVPVNGSYSLEVWWTSGSDRSSSVCYRVSHSGIWSDVYLDQHGSGGGEWVTAGSFTFEGDFMVQLLCSESASGSVAADAVRLLPPLGAEKTEPHEITLLQNPASSFTFIFTEGEFKSLKIFDLQGRTVDELAGTGSVTWSPEELPPGVYFAADISSGLLAKLVLLR